LGQPFYGFFALDASGRTLQKWQTKWHVSLLHADRGSSMTSKSVALLLADLGVTKTHSRPYVSNDNPHPGRGGVRVITTRRLEESMATPSIGNRSSS
jgi:hypothetical protein